MKHDGDLEFKAIELKERSKNFARYAHYTCIMAVLIVALSLIDAIVL